MPRGETVVMLLTVIPTVATDNLAIGVGVGVLTSMALFARRVAHLLSVERTVSPDGTSVTYRVEGELFFASNEELTDAFHHPDDPARILIDMSRAHVWDASAVSALDALTTKYEKQGKSVEITGLNEPSSDLHDALSGQLAGAH
nr:STAS domain-containing protein [Patulibacter americanus]